MLARLRERLFDLRVRLLRRRITWRPADYDMTPEQWDAAYASGSPVVLAGSPWVRIDPGTSATSSTTFTYRPIADSTWKK